jgi:serine/threonine protein phosphatase PrpC
MQGWRKYMEDTYVIDCNFEHGCSFFAVFDGHGGSEVASYCARHFGKQLKKLQEWKEHKYEEALVRAFLAMDEQMLTPQGQRELKSLKLADGMPSKAGCASIVALIVEKTLYLAHLGDCKAALMTENLNFVSKDHLPDDYGEQIRIAKAGGFIKHGRVNGILNMSRALGDFEFKSNKFLPAESQAVLAVPEIKKFEINTSIKYMLLGSDGLWELNSLPSIQKSVKTFMPKSDSSSVARTCESLLDLSIAKDTNHGLGCDNMTTILVIFHA